MLLKSAHDQNDRADAPYLADAHNNRANALMELGRLEQALASYDQALRIAPQSFDVLNNRGTALLELKRAEEALASFERTLQLKPFARLLQLDPDRDYGLGNLIRSRMHCCDWSYHAPDVERLAAGANMG